VVGNWTSLVPIGVQREDLADREALWRLLSGQLRERLASQTDLGLLGLAALFGRQPRHSLWAIELFLRYAFSLWYAYFGALTLGEWFGGAGIEEVFSVGPCWAPTGLTLLANQHRGRLLLAATYVPEAVPEPQVNAFLDLLLADLDG
jgi:hypothetical protein